jgi:FMN hydrolase / 5-amino-6-(5-phospho-D-ribitylamino)uracil phosphatase
LAIQFYRALPAPIKVLSFDLDDTLYYNDDVIHRAEQAQYDVLSTALPDLQTHGLNPWLSLKWEVLKTNPELKHDVTAWRQAVIHYGLMKFSASYRVASDKTIGDLAISKNTNCDVTKNDGQSLKEQAFQAFYDARSDFTIEPQVFEILAKLKQRFPLVAVTNGNVDIERIGLSQFFVGYYRAGERGNKMKPWPDMLNMASQHLDIPTQNILHLGDNVNTDLKGAHRAHCPSFWFNPDKKPMPAKTSLPNAEYSHLEDLLQLL